MTRALEAADVSDVVEELQELAYERYLGFWLMDALEVCPPVEALAQLDAWADLPSAR